MPQKCPKEKCNFWDGFNQKCSLSVTSENTCYRSKKLTDFHVLKKKPNFSLRQKVYFLDTAHFANFLGVQYTISLNEKIQNSIFKGLIVQITYTDKNFEYFMDTFYEGIKESYLFGDLQECIEYYEKKPVLKKIVKIQNNALKLKNDYLQKLDAFEDEIQNLAKIINP